MKHILKMLSNVFAYNCGILLKITIIVGGIWGVLDKFRALYFVSVFLGAFTACFIDEYTQYKKRFSKKIQSWQSK